MTRIGLTALGVPACLLLSVVWTVVSLPGAANSESPFCSVPPDPQTPWLPVTPLPHEKAVPSPRPASDCQFYRPAWHRFLVATQPAADGIPAFLRYPSFDEVFQAPHALATPAHTAGKEAVLLSLSPRNIERPNDPTPGQQALLDNSQAGLEGAQGGYLIDQHGRFVYYAIHVNPAFLQFLRNQGLTTTPGIKQMDPQFTFLGSDSDIQAGINTNIVEYKSAWTIVDEHHPPTNYFVVSARVPHYIVSDNTLSQEMKDGKKVFDTVKVALLAIHVVFTLPGHPEMIWSTFEHVQEKNGSIVRDNAPAASDNPSLIDQNKAVSSDNFPLYKANTLWKDGNQPISDLKTIAQYWDGKTQSFTKGMTVQTSVFRPYPGSKTNGSSMNPDHMEDDEIIRINNHATDMFKDAKAKGLLSRDDQRQNYRLVGAIWLDQPAAGPSPTFLLNKSFTIDSQQSTDDDG